MAPGEPSHFHSRGISSGSQGDPEKYYGPMSVALVALLQASPAHPAGDTWEPFSAFVYTSFFGDFQRCHSIEIEKTHARLVALWCRRGHLPSADLRETVEV